MVPTLRLWSGVDFPGIAWFFYLAALAILYSAARQDAERVRCMNGHVVQANANFCARCGQPVMRS